MTNPWQLKPRKSIQANIWPLLGCNFLETAIREHLGCRNLKQLRWWCGAQTIYLRDQSEPKDRPDQSLELSLPWISYPTSPWVLESDLKVLMVWHHLLHQIRKKNQHWLLFLTDLSCNMTEWVIYKFREAVVVKYFALKNIETGVASV